MKHLLGEFDNKPTCTRVSIFSIFSTVEQPLRSYSYWQDKYSSQLLLYHSLYKIEKREMLLNMAAFNYSIEHPQYVKN